MDDSYVYIIVLDHPFRTYVKVYEKLTFLPPQLLTCTNQEVRNVSFLQNSNHVLNGWSLSGMLLIDTVRTNIHTTIKMCKVPFSIFCFSCNVEGQ